MIFVDLARRSMMDFMHWSPWGAEWGTVPDAVAAVGTVGTLIVALILLRREIRERTAREQLDRRAQANQVSSWLTLDTDMDWTKDPTSTSPYLWTLHVRNASDQMIYNAVATLGEPIPKLADEWTALVVVGLGHLPPQSTQPFSDELRGRSFVRGEPQEALKRMRVAIAFTDAAGQHWRRQFWGDLDRKREPAAPNHTSSS